MMRYTRPKYKHIGLAQKGPVIAPQWGIGVFAFQKYCLGPQFAPESTFKCVKISPNLTISA